MSRTRMPKILIFRFSKTLVKTQISFPYFEKSDQQILQGCDLDSDHLSMLRYFVTKIVMTYRLKKMF